MATQQKKVAVVGSGLLGSSWAMLFANAGYKVTMYDVEQAQLDKALVGIRENFEMLAKNELLLGEQTIEQRMALISVTTDLEKCLAGAFYVQESAPENLELKQQLYARFDASEEIAKSKTKVVLASSSSSMPISTVTFACKRRDQSIICHPLYPVFYLRVVEIVPAPYTDPAITSLAREVMLSIGRAPVVCRREIPGFVVNRLQWGLMSEAWNLINDGILEPDELDLAVAEGLGPRWAFFGPWEITTLNAPNGTIDYCTRFNKPCENVLSTFKPPAVFRPEHATTQHIGAVMEKRVPAEHLEEFRRLRDTYLQEVVKAKIRFDKEKMIAKWKTD